MGTLAIFGAGTGLGRSVARRFGADDRPVALVGRTAATLDAVTAELRSDGVAATSYLADLRDPSAAVEVAGQITRDLGPIEILEYAPISTAPFVPAADLELDALDRTLDLYVRTPVSLIRTVLPSMLDAGRGIVLVGHGASALHPQPGISGVGPAMTLDVYADLFDDDLDAVSNALDRSRAAQLGSNA